MIVHLKKKRRNTLKQPIIQHNHYTLPILLFISLINLTHAHISHPTLELPNNDLRARVLTSTPTNPRFIYHLLEASSFVVTERQRVTTTRKRLLA